MGTVDLLEKPSEESLPEMICDGTAWCLYDSIREHGLLPGRPGPGKGSKKGSEGRQHFHFFSEEVRGNVEPKRTALCLQG